MASTLVTGASRGIGRAIAVAASARGDRVAVHYGRDRTAAERTLQELEGNGHVLVAGDLSDPATAQSVFEEANEALGTIEVLVNNAALAPTAATSHRVADTDYSTWVDIWRRMIDVDLLAATNVTYLVAQSLIAADRPGAIVNVGSRGANRGEPDFPAYGAAKAGLHAFGQSMAVALAPHSISVTTVAPGFISTERQASALAGEGGDGIRAQSPFGRVGTPDEIAAAVMYLTSPQAQWASGAVLDLNGASHLR
ncbi:MULTISPECIES: SDR family oxidoreductase [unclassified Microbacterium]|uniref:SDR family NAD(P)-dependent oxidoreductase n=1 Tax=unclassified Microbacterium TaxID=2609290 RepID=UPI00214BF852|nr:MULTISPECIES: SDR family oxidoreductase [unclassified Microbacterium]MCR2784597.1 SDR family oxidoreductase [Microbacterium sp. zg.B96]MDL5350484.1 SDR family oxidoreductase [Microbacterium sp. zg-YB36]WIM14596.1 SDR family oxidoreductase [Microbacterium sp. zg-B96]